MTKGIHLPLLDFLVQLCQRNHARGQTILDAGALNFLIYSAGRVNIDAFACAC
jgi:hypothetical protein